MSTATAEQPSSDPEVMTANAQGQLKSFFERIERIRGDIAEAQAAERDVFAEAKGLGFDTKAMRVVLVRRAADRIKLQEQDAIVDLYASATGGL